MPNIYTCKIYKSVGGRSGSFNQWTNIYHFISDEEITGASIADFVTRALAFERAFHLTAVTFMRSVVTLVGDGIGDYERGVTRTFDHNVTGLQGDVGEMEPVQMVMRMRFGTSGSRGKVNSYRGALGELAVTSVGSGDPTIAPATYGTMPSDLPVAIAFRDQSQAAKLVVQSKKKTDPVPVVSSVVSMSIAGVGFRQRRVKRKPKNVSDEGSFLETLIEIGKALGPLIVFALSKGKALPPAARLPLQLAATNAAGDFTTLAQLFDGDETTA